MLFDYCVEGGVWQVRDDRAEEVEFVGHQEGLFTVLQVVEALGVLLVLELQPHMCGVSVHDVGC